MAVPDFLEFCQYRVCRITCNLQNDTVSKPHLPCTGMTGKSSGSGFLIENTSGELLVVTNFHVVANAIQITASFADEQPVDVIVLTVNPQFDLAVLVLGEGATFPNDSEAFELSKFEISKNLTTDTKLYAAGFPLGMSTVQVEQGNRTGYHVSNEDVLLQHSALLNPGNSGGPLVVKHEKFGYVVVGINNAIVAGAQGIDFSILVERLAWILDVFEQTRAVVQARFQLGFTYQHGYPSLRKTVLQLKGTEANTEGVFVTKVYKHVGGVGEGVVKQHDYLHSVNGIQISDSGTVVDPQFPALGHIPLQVYLAREKYGSIQEFDILRNGPNGEEYYAEEVHGHLVNASIGPRTLYVPYERPDFEILSGMVLVDMSTNAEKEFQLGVAPGAELEPAVVVVSVLPQGEVSSELASPGTIIRLLNWKPIRSIADIRQIFSELWHSDMDTVIFTTATGAIITLPLVTLHEDNETIRTIYGESAASKSIPHSTASVGICEAADSEVALLEKELHESLGIQ